LGIKQNQRFEVRGMGYGEEPHPNPSPEGEGQNIPPLKGVSFWLPSLAFA